VVRVNEVARGSDAFGWRAVVAPSFLGFRPSWLRGDVLAGARSQVSGLTAAALTVVTLFFLTGLFEELPEASLAAIVIAAVIELVDVAALRRLWRAGAGPLVALAPYTRRVDFLAAVGALAGVLVFDTLPGLVIGIGISLLLLIARTSRPNIAELAPTVGSTADVWVDRKRHPDLAPLADTLVVRVEGPLMFTDADFVRDQVLASVAARAAAGTPVSGVVLDGETVPGVDVTAAAMLTQLHRELGQVRDVLSASEGGEEPPIYPTIDDALGRW
jgi:SulP family sulfate permease